MFEKNSLIRQVSLTGIFSLVACSIFGQTTYYARVTDGTWTAPATWSTESCGGTAATTFPGQTGTTDIVIICSGITVKWNNTRGKGVTIGSLIVQASGDLKIDTNDNITCTNSIVIDGTIDGDASRGDLRIAAGGTLKGTGSFSATNANSLLRFNGNGSIDASADLKFDNNGRFSCNGNTVINYGKISILNPSGFQGTGTFENASTGYLLYAKQANWPTTATVTLNTTAVGNTVEFAATTGGPFDMDPTSNYHHLIISGSAPKNLNDPGTTNVTGDLTIKKGSTLNANVATNINIGGNFIINNNPDGTFNPDFARVTFNGTVDQTISPLVAGQTFYDLAINNTAAGGTVTANGPIYITAGRILLITRGIFDMGVYTLGETGAFAHLDMIDGELRLGKSSVLGAILPELTGSYDIEGGTITFNGLDPQTIKGLNQPTTDYYNIKFLGGTKTLNGNITVMHDWINMINNGATIEGNVTVTFSGDEAQTITNTSGAETFYDLTVNTTGPLNFATNVMVTNTLTMTTGNINLNNKTLSLGNSVTGPATLVRTAGVAYHGIFKRYFPTSPISSTAAPLYGLFPVGTANSLGTSGLYRPVEINSTINPTTAGDVSVSHTDAYTYEDVNYTYNDTTIQRITDMKSTISTSSLSGGTYDLAVTFSALDEDGNLANLKLQTIASPHWVGKFARTTGTTSNPTVKRIELNKDELNNVFVIGTTDKGTTPMETIYYSRHDGSWNNDNNDPSGTWSTENIGSIGENIGGAPCGCVPTTSSLVYVGHTVTVDAAATTNFIVVTDGGTLDGTDDLTAHFDITTQGTGKIAPTGGNWIVSRDLTISGTSSSTSTAKISVAEDLEIDASNSLAMSNDLTVSRNLIVDGTLAMGNNTLFLTGSGASIIGHKVPVPGGGAATITGNGLIKVDFAKSIARGSNLTIAPVIELSAATELTNHGTVTTTNNITGVDGTTSKWINGANAILNTTGEILTTGILDASILPNTINYNATGSQTIAPSTYYDIRLSNSGTKTLGGNIQVDDELTIQSPAVLDVGPHILNGAGGLTMTGTSSLLIAMPAAGTYPGLTGTYTLSGGTITFNQATAGTFTLRREKYADVVLNGSNADYEFAPGVRFHNLTVTLSGNSKMNNSNPVVVDSAFVFNSTSSVASTLNGNFTVGSFTLTNGKLTNNQTLEIDLAGGWTRTGGTYTSTGTEFFDGGADQTIGGSVSTTFNNLTLDNSGPNGVFLNLPTTVNGILTLDIGHIVTTTTNILNMAGGSSVLEVSNSSFVAGPMTKTGTTAFTFPVGKSEAYRPITISDLTNPSSTFRAEYFDTAAPYSLTSNDGTLNHVANGEYWQLDRIGVGDTGDPFVTLSWDYNSGTVDKLLDLRVAKWEAATSQWINLGNGGTTGAVSPETGTIKTAARITSFSPFTLASATVDNPLPIELLDFTAKLSGNKVLLNWTTSSELNNDYFTLSKSRNGMDFFDFAKVKGSGTTTVPTYYSALDEKPYTGVSYYRLSQTDYDGVTKPYKIVKIDNDNEQEASIIIYPNPAVTEMNISLSGFGKMETVMIEVKDVLGKLIYSTEQMTDADGAIQTSITQSTLASGLYVFTFVSNSETMSERVVVR